MKKFLIPATLLLASTLGGAAFAGSAAHAESEALYGQPNPFAAVKSPAATHYAFAGHQDQRLDAGSQQASMTYVPQNRDWAQQDWAQPAPAAHDGFHDPE